MFELAKVKVALAEMEEILDQVEQQLTDIRGGKAGRLEGYGWLLPEVIL